MLFKNDAIMTHSHIREEGKMIDYRKMYMILFHGITDAVFHIEKRNYCFALNVLIQAQQAAEEIYVQAGEEF